jgi:hypothetical protein
MIVLLKASDADCQPVRFRGPVSTVRTTKFSLPIAAWHTFWRHVRALCSAANSALCVWTYWSCTVGFEPSERQMSNADFRNFLTCKIKRLPRHSEWGFERRRH